MYIYIRPANSIIIEPPYLSHDDLKELVLNFRCGWEGLVKMSVKWKRDIRTGLVRSELAQ